MFGSRAGFRPPRLLGVITFFAASLLAYPQDTRTVIEPVIPPSCTTLVANLAAASSGLRESDENKLDTARIQQAVDNCPAGRAVELKAAGNSNAFLSGPLRLKTGVMLHIDEGVTLFGSRNPHDYDTGGGTCGTVNESGRGCRPLIGGDYANDSGVVGDGTIDGRGGMNLIGEKVSWWDLAQQAKVTNKSQNCPRILVLNHCDDFTLYRVTLKNSPNFHVAYNHGNGFTAWGVIINTPKTARNTDGIDPGNSTNVTITHCYIHAGDDQVAIKAGNSGPTTHMTISHNHFYTGHGMSIGSETDGGASHILVSDLTIDGADNGLRIKSNSSRGGLVQDVLYENVCIRNTKNPIFMDSNYSFYGKARNKLPHFENITLRNVQIEGGGKITLQGYDRSHQLGIAFDNVVLRNPADYKIVAAYANVKLGPGAVNLRPSGPDVQVTRTAGHEQSTFTCDEKFVPMPNRN